MITKEQADRIHQASADLLQMKAELRESTEDAMLFVHPGMYGDGPLITVKDPGLVPADVEPVRTCGYNPQIKWEWEEHGVTFCRTVTLATYLEGVGSAIPKHADACSKGARP